MKVSRRATFNAAHRLFRSDWTQGQNEEIFGKCSNPNYHGHNYVLEVVLEGEVDPETGYVIDLKIVKNAIQSEISDRFDHRNLNLDCPEFKGLNPTAENIAIVAWQLMRRQIGLTIKLWETENNCVEYAGK